jgi:transposase InsO family protein
MKADSVVKALKIAVKNRRGKEKLIHHSDRGSQYCSDLYQKELRKNAILPSTNRWL